MSNQTVDSIRDAVSTTIRHHWKLFLAEGVILIILGFFAVAVPLFAGLAITIILGSLFLASGLVGLITTFAMRYAPGFWWSLLSAVLAIVVGALLLARPGLGLVSLTYVLIAFFIVEGSPRSCTRSSPDDSSPAAGAGCSQAGLWTCFLRS